MPARRMSWCACLLSFLVGCGPKPAPQTVPAPPGPVAPVAVSPSPAEPLIKPATMAADDWKAALQRDYPAPLRGGKTDEQLARELETEAFAFEFRGGPIHWWFEATEEGQSSVSADKPVAELNSATTAEGRLVVSVGREWSERLKEAMQKIGKESSAERVSAQLRVKGHPGGQGGTSAEGVGKNALWYGWAGDKDVKATAFTIETAKPGDTVTVLTLTCVEPMPADKAKPKRVTLTLKAKFVAAAAKRDDK